MVPAVPQRPPRALDRPPRGRVQHTPRGPRRPITNQAPFTTVAAQRMLAKNTTKSCTTICPGLKNHSIQVPRSEAHCSSHCFPAPFGRIGLRDYLWQSQRTDSPLCDCGDCQTIRHVLLDCSRYRALREVWGATGSDWKAPRPPTTMRAIWESQCAKKPPPYSC